MELKVLRDKISKANSTSLAKAAVSSMFQKRHCLKEESGEQSRKTADGASGLHRCTQLHQYKHKYTYKCTHTHTYKEKERHTDTHTLKNAK